jgi:raffinose/stachyose/melibiose transport system substrate-binding protein
MKKFTFRTFTTFAILALSSTMLFANGSKETTTTGELDKNIKATITLACYKSNIAAIYSDLDLEAQFQKLYPNVNVEVEVFKDSGTYEKNMKIRASANQLPDIMLNKGYSLGDYKDFLLPLNEDLADVISNNSAARAYAIDGVVYAIPRDQSGDLMLVRKDMLDAIGLEMPTTWPQFLEVTKALQEHYSAIDPDFSAIAIGAKDEWPTYPYAEFMPLTITGNGNLWNDAADMDAPFAPGEDLYEAYKMTYDLFQSGVCGKDPLGVAPNQALGLFEDRKAAMINCNPGGATQILEDLNGDFDGIVGIKIPSRMSTSDPYRAVTQGDNMLGVTTSSKNPALAKAFLKFYFSDAWYPQMMSYNATTPTMAGLKSSAHPIIASANTDETEYVFYTAYEEKVNKIESYIQFNCKKEGTKLFIDGLNFEEEMADLNTKWADARKNLGYSK